MKSKVTKEYQGLQYKDIKDWFKNLPNTDRWLLFNELYIDLYFLEYDENHS
ncbi:hypothetical protein LCGC14_1761360 [marine sediment metagenome]|uniref:Uncharacterized protein n=1 Tax=marine sediment metagenome TaxID=412755 RepID=A0A0F9H0Y1_9ZZZZ